VCAATFFFATVAVCFAGIDGVVMALPAPATPDPELGTLGGELTLATFGM
jgi:hypothetical protein